MADADQILIPTATEVYDAVRKIRESKPGLGLKKLVVILRDEHGWSIHGSRLRKLVAPGDGTNGKHETSKVILPTLSGVLGNAEIRNRILGPLLTVTDHKFYVEEWTKNFPGLNLLRVSGDIRKIAWAFLRDNNIWVQTQFVWDSANLVQSLPSAILNTMNNKEHTKPALVQANFGPDLFNPDMIKEFRSSVAVIISIGHSQGHGKPVNGAESKVLPVFFAFHPRKYELFVRDLADTVGQWRCMTVDVNHAHVYKFPDTIPVVVDQIIRGLDQIREADRVTFPSLQKDPIDPVVDFKAIAQTMMSPREAKSEIRASLLEFYARGIKSMDKGEYREAYSIFREAQHAYQAFHQKQGPKPKFGSIEHNMVEHALSDIVGMASESLSREISARRSMSIDGHAGPRLLTRETSAYDVSLAIVLAQMSLSSPSLTDEQRCYGHYRRAVAYALLGNFLTELQTVVPRSEHAGILADSVAIWNDGEGCYKKAAQDAFYAVHVADIAGAEITQELVDTMDALRRHMCGKIGCDADDHLAQMQRAGLTRVQLPVLGLWEGDPTLYMSWGPKRMMLMALFRQREGSGGPNAADLREALAQRGLRWVHDQRGQIYLEGTAEARMSPTWVVPDDTRDGLRAAGLSGDKFEMARR